MIAGRHIALALVLGACGTSHHPVVDAGPVDASIEPRDSGHLEPDAGPRDAGLRRPDAGPPCVDEDGDGAAAAACGGDDCDDTDPRVGPIASYCLDATTRRACGADPRTGTSDAVCPDDLPLCDAVSGACVELGAGCGDGTLHEGEECDDGNGVEGDGCGGACLIEPCDGPADCPAERPSCSDRRTDGRVVCRALSTGLALGSVCDDDTECASGWCDDAQRRCTARCEMDPECGPLAEGWCARRGPPGGEPICAFGCFRDADCHADRVCWVGWYDESRATLTRCIVPPGSVPAGEPCTRSDDCRSSFCDITGTAVGRVCHTHCIDPTTDCPAVLPRCVEVGDVPPHWSYPVLSVCRAAIGG